MKYLSRATWDGERWCVSVADGENGLPDTTAPTLAEAAPNVSAVLGARLGIDPGLLSPDIGIEVHLPEEIAKPLQIATGLLADVTTKLRHLGLPEGDIAALLAARTMPSAPAENPGEPIRGQPWRPS